uniref:Uncharacterized protein n=1 Tax=Calidris pygmaea TaxID=425635 RepID=A0A8C3JBL8_9CHAR
MGCQSCPQPSFWHHTCSYSDNRHLPPSWVGRARENEGLSSSLEKTPTWQDPAAPPSGNWHFLLERTQFQAQLQAGRLVNLWDLSGPAFSGIVLL